MTTRPALPRWIYLPAAVGALFVVLPLVAVIVKVDWPHFWTLISSESSRTALVLSLKTAAASTLLCVLLGVPMALVLARNDGRAVQLVRPILLLPLVLPPVVGGIALLYAFGRLGLIGQYLDAAGIRIAFTTTAVVLAQTFVSLPFLVIALEGAARTAGHDYDVVAATLGARPTTVWWRVSLPLLAPGLVSGAVLAFARSLGEFGATLTFAGSRRGGHPDATAGDLPAARIRCRRGRRAVGAVGRGRSRRRAWARCPQAADGSLDGRERRMTGMHLRAVIDDRGLDIEFSIAAGEVLAVLGPNGSGKSTTMHVIAGLVRPDTGLVRLGDRVLTDTAAGVFVPTYARRVGLLLQGALLFPHLNVAANVAFAPRSGHSKRPRREARATAAHWLAQVDAGDLADRMPRQLSGGQAQRVALARALAADPDVLLLDEPLAGLDVSTASAMRKLLRDKLSRDGRSAVLITHDLLDVLTLADRVLILESGKIVETGSAASVLAAPRSRFGARFAGVNLVSGTAGPRRCAQHGVGRRVAWQPRTGCGRRAGRRRGLHTCRRRRLPRQAARQPEKRASRSPSPSWTAGGPPFACAPTSNPTARPAWPPTSPPSPQPICGWRRESVSTSRSKRRRSRFTRARNGGSPRVDLLTRASRTPREQLFVPAIFGLGASTCYAAISNFTVKHSKTDSHLRHDSNTVVSSAWMSRTRSLNAASAARRRWRWPRWPAPRWWPSRCRPWRKPTRSRRPRRRTRRPPSGNTFLAGAAGRSQRTTSAGRSQHRRRLPIPMLPPPPLDPNAPAADPNAPPPAPAPEPGRIDNAAGGFSYVVPAGWKVSDATQLSYGQALLTKATAEDAPPANQASTAGATQPPNDTSVLLGRLDMKLFAGAEADNAKAATRLASDMGEFFMPFPGTRVNQENAGLTAGDMPGAATRTT